MDLAARYGGEEFVLAWYHPLPGELQQMGEQLQHTDGALFQAKADGRNRVVVLASCADPAGPHPIHEAGRKLGS